MKHGITKFTGRCGKCPAKHLLKFNSCKKSGCPFATNNHTRNGCKCEQSYGHGLIDLFNLDHLPMKMPKDKFIYYPYWLHTEEMSNLCKLAEHFDLYIDVGEGNEYHEDALQVLIVRRK